MNHTTSSPESLRAHRDSLRAELEQLSRSPSRSDRIEVARRVMLELNRAELLLQSSRKPAASPRELPGNHS